MLDPFKVAVDHNLVVLTLATYVVGTLGLDRPTSCCARRSSSAPA